jgi:hypothetical protein
VPLREPLFSDTKISGSLEVVTFYNSSRSGAKPVRRVTRRITTGASGESRALGAELSSTAGVQDALKLLNESRARGTRRLSENSVRNRLSRRGRKHVNTQAIIDSLIGLGVLEREETLDRAHTPIRSYLTVTEAGRKHLDAAFGTVPPDPREDLAGRLETYLSECRRPVIRRFLSGQLDAVRSGGPVFFLQEADSQIDYLSPKASPNYLRILEFFAYLGSQPEGVSLEFKEISGRLHLGERDSVKHLEDLRQSIAQVAESDLGVSLEELGVRGAHLLYWIPFHGDLAVDGQSIWGTVPAISTRDLRAASAIETSARLLVLVENRAALDILAEESVARDGWLVVCTDGMPKHGLYHLLEKMSGLSSVDVLIWTDWDLGGLRIAERLLAWFESYSADSARGIDDKSRIATRGIRPPQFVLEADSNLTPGPSKHSTATLVPHPGTAGRAIEVPESYLGAENEDLRRLAQDIEKYGAVYQEESFWAYKPAVLERFVSGLTDV